MVSDRQEGMSDFLTCLFMMGIVSPRRFLLFWIPFFLVLWDPGKHFSLYRDNIAK